MLLSNAVFVDRANRQKALSTFQQVAEVMKQKGTSLFIFVEGTRNSSPTPSLLPFKVLSAPESMLKKMHDAEADLLFLHCRKAPSTWL